MDPFIGEIRLLPFAYCPADWHVCDGSRLPVQQYQALYSLLGDRFGSYDGMKTFALPKMDAPANMKYCIALVGIYPPRD